MTTATVVDAPPVAVEVVAVRRWARANFWAVIIVTALGVGAAVLFPPPSADTAFDALIVATAPVAAILEALLLLAVYRLFRGRARTLAVLTVVAGGASIVSGLAAAALVVTDLSALESATTFASAALTGMELVLLGGLLRNAAAAPQSLWLLGFASAVGIVVGSLTTAESPDLLLAPAILILAFPVFLYQLGKLTVQPVGATPQ